MERWQYATAQVWKNDEKGWVVGDDGEPLQHYLDRVGREGWELVSVAINRLTNQWSGILASQKDYHPPQMLYFKRPGRQ